MSGRFGLESEVVRCCHQATTDEGPPDPVYHHPGGERVAAIDNELRHLEAAMGGLGSRGRRPEWPV